MSAVRCDRCGKPLDWFSDWGVCECCGDNLCEDCAGGFDEKGFCQSCSFENPEAAQEEEFLFIGVVDFTKYTHKDREEAQKKLADLTNWLIKA